jgi:type I restriction enzyme S subunit
MPDPSQLRTYDPADSVVFRKTNERFGGLSNMAPGFPIRLNGVRIRTSEALYQACRFPHMPEVQELIIREKSPMTAKMRSKPYRDESRSDWMAVRTKIMRWCLRVKLAQNWKAFSTLLLETGDRPIVEYSRKDDFWGAQPQEDGTLVGMNVLGRLLMELRENVAEKPADELRHVEPLPLENFCLFSRLIEGIGEATGLEANIAPDQERPSKPAKQPSLFDDPTPEHTHTIQTSHVAEAARMETLPMIDQLAPYPQIRNSGLDWLGEIPAHWQVRRAKYLFREVNDRSEHGEETHLSMSQKLGLVPADQVTQRSLVSESYAGAKLVKGNDLVLNRLKAHLGVFAYAKQPGVVSPDYTVLRPTNVTNVRFMEYVLKSPSCRGELRIRTKGIVEGLWRLYTDDFYAIELPHPSLEEQRAIVRVLDWHGAQVSRLVRAKKRQIELVTEERNAVTEMLMRADGTRSERLGAVADRIQRPIEREGDEVYLPVGLFNRGRGIFHKPPCLGAELGDSTFFYLEEGDLVLSGQFAWEGAVALAWNEDSNRVASHRYYSLRGKEGVVTNAYLYALFQTRFGDLILNHHSRGAAGRNRPLNIGTLLKEKVPVPSFASQRELSELVILERKMNQSVSLFVDHIREFRTRLIADIVTGKLDVRGLAAMLPDTSKPELDGLLEEDDLADGGMDAEENEEEAA